MCDAKPLQYNDVDEDSNSDMDNCEMLSCEGDGSSSGNKDENSVSTSSTLRKNLQEPPQVGFLTKYWMIAFLTHHF